MSILKSTQVDLQIERRIILGMIINDDFLKEILSIYSPSLLKSRSSRIIAEWCREYYEQYEKAPKKDIQGIFTVKQEQLDDDVVQSIERLLTSLSDEFEEDGEKFNTQYLLDQAEERFKAVSLENLSDEIKGHLAVGEVKDAENLLADYNRVSRPTSSGINPFTDVEAIRAAFEIREEDILFEFPGALGRMLGPMERENFIGITAPDKRGKTFWLLEFSLRAYLNKCNVALFECGDMSERQVMRRIYSYITRTPLGANKKIYIPILDCERNQTGECKLADREGSTLPIGAKLYRDAPDHITCTLCSKDKNNYDEFIGAVWQKEKIFTKYINWEDGVKYGKNFMEKVKRNFKLACFPNDTISVDGIKRELDLWEKYEDFVPDVIVIDYADILATMDARLDFRHSQDKTWKSLRALSQIRRCLVVTATQSDAAAYGKERLTISNFSETKTKNAHVTSMIALNQTPEEKRMGIIRIGELVVREKDFDTEKDVVVLQCLAIGRPFLGSYELKKRK